MQHLDRKSSLATRSVHRRVAGIDLELINLKAAEARSNPRLREIHCLHFDDSEPLHRMLNAIQPGSFVPPHRHLNPSKSEAFIILQGRLGVISFLEDGSIDPEGTMLLSRDEGLLGVDIREGVWHTIVALAPDTVVFEVKPGPYERPSDKDFAPWAPREGTDEAKQMLAAWERLFTGGRSDS